MLEDKNVKRIRGVVLTEKGLERLEHALHALGHASSSNRCMARVIEIDATTLSKIRTRRKPVDRRSIEQVFRFLGLNLEGSDIQHPYFRRTWKPAQAFPQTHLFPDTTSFLGREALLEDLNEWANNGRCLVINGHRGVGKTWLAIELIRRMEGKFEGLCWIPVEPGFNLQSLIQSCFRTWEKHPGEQTTGEAIRDWLTFICDRRWLIVLDGLDHLISSNPNTHNGIPAELQSLLFTLEKACEIKHSSLLIVTTKHRLRPLELQTASTETVRHLSLSGLTTEELGELLEQNGYDRSHQQEIHQLSAGNPGLTLTALRHWEQRYGGDRTEPCCLQPQDLVLWDAIIQEILELEFAQLSPELRQLARQGAIQETALTPESATHLNLAGEDAAGTVLSQLIRLEQMGWLDCVTDAEHGYRFQPARELAPFWEHLRQRHRQLAVSA